MASTDDSKATSAKKTLIEKKKSSTGAAAGRNGVFTLEEVARHNTAEDCWIVAHGVVYDVTEYIAEHPGGSFAIVRHAGKVCDSDFDFHSPHAQRTVWSRYAIGRIEGSSCVVM